MYTYYEGRDALIIALRAEELQYVDEIAKACLDRMKSLDWEEAECELFQFSTTALLMMRPARPKCLRGNRQRLRLERR